MKYFPLLIWLLLSGCATTGGYEKVLESFVGSDVNKLIENWGPPADTYEMPNGKQMFTWYRDRGSVAMPIGGMAYAVKRSCKTTFIVNKADLVESWRYEGNACKA